MEIKAFNSNSAHVVFNLAANDRDVPFQGAITSVEEISIPGYLNVEGFTERQPYDYKLSYFLPASHVVIKETSGDKLRPMPLNASNTAYTTLPAGYEYHGVLYQDTPIAQPLCIAVTKGAFKESLSPYPLTPAIKSALTGITFS